MGEGEEFAGHAGGGVGIGKVDAGDGIVWELCGGAGGEEIECGVDAGCVAGDVVLERLDGVQRYSS